MPRVVFQLLWDYIQSGLARRRSCQKPRARWAPYWVVALVVPIPKGYLSVRFKPTSPLLATVQRLYMDLKAVETSIESDSSDRKAAIAASKEVLDTSLKGLGFSGYDSFMQQLLKTEMQSREAACCPVTAAREVNSVSESSELDRRKTAAALFDKLVEVLNVLFSELEVYVDINKGVRARSVSVTDISESLRVSALNGVIAVDKLGSHCRRPPSRTRPATRNKWRNHAGSGSPLRIARGIGQRCGPRDFWLKRCKAAD
jgi:hypothetical protein